MKKPRRIGVDLMGGDCSPSTLLEALKTLPLPPHVSLAAIGSPKWAQSAAPPLVFYPAKEVIETEEPPLLALRKKREASLLIGIRLLKEKKIDALVSAGNTGALISAAKMTLGMHRGILRPALLVLMPTKKAPVAVLDVGANVQIKATHLLQFAFLGAAYQKTRGIPFPAVGILNIGSEALKGTSELRTAYQELEALKHPSFRFSGNIEGKTVFDGEVDVLVTDGFTGNVFLKTAEGLANLVLDRLSTHIPLKTLQPYLADLRRQLHYAEYPGALIAGVKGIVIKCHGYSPPEGFASAVREAAELVEEGFDQIFENQLREF